MKNQLINLFKGILLSCFLLSYVTEASANTYYFSTSLGDDSRTATEAQEPATPWRTLAKLNSWFINLNSGDSVLFKRGDIFYGSITVSKSGSSGSPIVISAYGSGAKPIITGFATVSSWINLGGGIYESSSTISTLPSCNIVTIDDVVKGMGRYPNADASNGGYLTITSHINNTSITGASLPATFTGGELVIRKQRWVLDKCKVTAQSGSTLAYTGGTSYYNSQDGFGYFIQNHLNTLDKFGEWYFDPSTKKLSLYFGSSNPSSFSVQTSDISNLITASSKSNIIFDNLAFKGANGNIFFIPGCSNIVIDNCEMSKAVSGIWCYPNGTSNITVSNNRLSSITDYGVLLTNSTNNRIQNNTLSNIGTIAGSGSSGDGGQQAIWISGAGHLVEYNKIDTVGFQGIRFEGGNNTVIRNNFVNYFCFLKDDGGGIYTYNGNGSTVLYTGQKITNNIILNAVGASLGTNAPSRSEAYGIYMDENSSGVEITYNTVANGSSYGILNHNAHDIVYGNNTLFNNMAQALWWQNATNNPVPVRKLSVKNNIFFSRLASQDAVRFYCTTGTSDVSLFGVYDSNYYCRPIAETTPIVVSQPSFSTYLFYSLSTWQANYKNDIQSKKTSITLTDTNKIRFEYNATASSKTIALGGTYTGVDNTTYPGSITLSPYTSIILMQSGVQNIAPAISITTPLANAAFNAPANIVINASASDTDGTISKVEFYSGNTLLGADNSSPYSFTWNNAAAGSYSITAKAHDNSGAYTISSPVVVSVSTANVTPTVSITSPVANAVFDAPASIVISASALDADGTISKVEFYNGNALLGSDNISPYNFTWNNVAAGNYSVTAKAIDNLGSSTTSASMVVSVSSPNVAPLISITSPGANAKFDAPANISITAAATDADGSIVKVDFYNGDALLASDNKSPYSFTWNSVAAGNYSITAKATDNGSLTTTSTAVNISVFNPNVAPAISITSPVTNDKFDAPATITVSAIATDADGLVAKVDFYNGNAFLGSDSTSPYSFTWNSVEAGNYSLTARATDNGLLVTNSSAVTVSVSNPNGAPIVNITSPVTNAKFEAPATITISATAADADGSVTKVDFYNGNTLLGTDNTSPYSFTWNNVAAGNYSLTAKATDNGSLVTSSSPVTISVFNSNVAPAIIITSPVTNATYIAPAMIRVTATATDTDGSISKVEFFNGATLLKTELQAPYDWTWQNVPAGDYIITAKATDNSGFTTTSSGVLISVSNPNVAPTIIITSPESDLTFKAPATVTINATAADSDGLVSKVDFYNGNTLLGSDNTSPYSFIWQNIATGNYIITAKATDNSGDVATSENVNIAIKENMAPTVSITSPQTGKNITAPATIDVSATASDIDGTIKKIEFYSDTTLLHVAYQVPYSYSWNNVPAGNYTIIAKATDNNDLSATSSSASISVVKPADTTPVVNSAPVVNIINPTSNSSYDSAQSINIDVEASDSDGIITKVDFYNGDNLLGSDSLTPYTFTWKNVATGTYYLHAKAYDNKNSAMSSAIVPVQVASPVAFAFTNFTGTVNGKDNLLSWSTTNCKNTSYFKVLRGQRRMSMKQIGKVQVVNSNSASLTYTFIDSAPYSGTNYYKIAAVDKFGKAIPSDIISVATTITMGKAGGFSVNSLTGKSNWQNKIADNIKDITIKVGPNPANSNLSIFIQGIDKNKALTISILSINGILLKTINSNTSNSVVLTDVSSFRAGTYLVQVVSGDKIVYKQFVKQ